MLQAKTMASKLASYKENNVVWRNVLNNAAFRFKIYCFVFTISDHLAGKMDSSHEDIIARLRDDRDLTRRKRQTSKEDDRQALPAETKSEFDEITNGFVLTDACTMHQAKTMASKLASYKFEHIQWRHVLNNATSVRGEICGGPTIVPIRDLLKFHLVSGLKKDIRSLLDPSTEEVSEALNECKDEWHCAILNMPNSFTMEDQLAFKVAAAAESKALASQKVCLLAFSHLLLRGAKAVLLRKKHWNCDVTTIQQDATSISCKASLGPDSDFPLAPAPPARSEKTRFLYKQPAPGQTEKRDNDICDILIQMIHRSESGWVNPTQANDWRRLCPLVKPGTLKQFLESHPKFQVWTDAHGDHKTWWFGLAQSEKMVVPNWSERGPWSRHRWTPSSNS